jgi:hypothetical protein
MKAKKSYIQKNIYVLSGLVFVLALIASFILDSITILDKKTSEQQLNEKTALEVNTFTSNAVLFILLSTTAILYCG